MTDILMRPIIAMQVAVHHLREREDGQTTTEYAILLGFLAIAIIIALFFLRNVLRSLFSSAASSVSRAPASPERRSAGATAADGSECAPARLPPRPGRCIRLCEVTCKNHPFGNRRFGGTMSDDVKPRSCRPGEGDRDSWIDPIVPIGAREDS